MIDNPPEKRRGRPLIDPRCRLSVQVTVRLQVAEYDAAYVAARRDRSSVAALLRKSLRRHGKL